MRAGRGRLFDMQALCPNTPLRGIQGNGDLMSRKLMGEVALCPGGTSTFSGLRNTGPDREYRFNSGLSQGDNNAA